MRDKVLRYIREQALLRAGDRLAVAVSGGADSVALLRVLLELKAELGVLLSVAHFNHGLRGEQSDADEAFVAELAKETGLELFTGHGDVFEHAKASKLSLEAAARQLRYRLFAQLAREQRLVVVATAHTLDDQAETVLLKFLRGAGTRGLAGIYPAIEGSADGPRVVRPLLCVSRQEVESYLTGLGQRWREDESNLDRRFLRNRVRHDLLPLLEREFNPNIRSALNDLADIARAEESFWEEATGRELAERAQRAGDAAGSRSKPRASASLHVDGFAGLPLAVQRRLLKRFADENELTLDFHHIDRLRRCALGEVPKVELPGGVVVSAAGSRLVLDQDDDVPRPPYSCLLPIPGETKIAEAGLRLRAYVVPPNFAREAEPGTLLSLDLVGTQLTIRNWSPGDRFWPAYSRSEEKLKRLFLERKVPAGDRSSWPVALCGAQIVWVRGFPVASTHQWRGAGEALKIEALEV